MNVFESTAGTIFGGTAGSAFSGVGENSGFPDVHIKDSKSGLDVPIGGGIGWDDDFIQAGKIIDFPLIFYPPTTPTIGVESVSTFVKRTSKFLVSIILDTLGGTIVVYPVYYDTNAVRTIGTSKTAMSVLANAGGGFDCPLLEFSTIGSAKMGFIISSIDTGAILSAKVATV